MCGLLHPTVSVGCNYLSLPEIPASGSKVLICTVVLYFLCQHRCLAWECRSCKYQTRTWSSLYLQIPWHLTLLGHQQAQLWLKTRWFFFQVSCAVMILNTLSLAICRQSKISQHLVALQIWTTCAFCLLWMRKKQNIWDICDLLLWHGTWIDTATRLMHLCHCL